tara:strand:- start:1286 stop:2488 length:1203 start_codon:yes stop_codon:yes gene_type:complete
MIFGWKITPLLDISILICLPVYVYALFKPRDVPLLISKSIWISAVIITLIAYNACLFLSNDPASTQWILRTIRSAISFGAVFIVIFETRRASKKNYIQDTLLSLAFAITMHAVIVNISQLSEVFRAALYTMTSAKMYVNEMTIAYDNRPLGLTYTLSITSFLYFISIAIFTFHKSEDKYHNLAKLIAIATNTIACVWTARTGLLFFPLTLIFIFQIIRNASIKKMTGLFITVIIMVLATILFTYFGPISIEHQIRRVSELFTLFTSPSESTFFQQFVTMWHLPNDLGQLLFGNSLTGREEGHYVASDVGYILAIYGIGLVGQLLMLLPIVIAGFASFKLLKTKSEYGLLALVVLGSYLILNVKELALMTRTVWPVICVFISISILEYQAKRNRLHASDSP